jgi:cytochrome c-type biogenesis protein CcmH/NrfG
VALSCQNRYDHAVEAYKKAVELDPENESYKINLSLAQEKLAQAPNTNNTQSQPVNRVQFLFLFSQIFIEK